MMTQNLLSLIIEHNFEREKRMKEGKNIGLNVR